MHFLMPQIFASHAQFKDWFNNPMLGMVEGQQEVNKVRSRQSAAQGMLLECAAAQYKAEHKVSCMPKCFKNAEALLLYVACALCDTSGRSVCLLQVYVDRQVQHVMLVPLQSISV